MSENEMQQADVVGYFLFPPDKNPAVAVHPRVDSFDDPPAGSLPPTALRFLLATRANVGYVTAAASRAADRVGIVAFVAAEMLFAPASRAWSRHRNAVKRGIEETLIVYIGTRNSEANRHATSVGENRPLGAQLTTIGRVFPGFFPRPAAPWFAPCPDSAIAMRCPAAHRNALAGTSKVRRRQCA